MPVRELWRYPVKSLGGERVQSARCCCAGWRATARTGCSAAVGPGDGPRGARRCCASAARWAGRRAAARPGAGRRRAIAGATTRSWRRSPTVAGPCRPYTVPAGHVRRVAGAAAGHGLRRGARRAARRGRSTSRRFRPTVVCALPEPFAEDDWIGRVVVLGDAIVRVRRALRAHRRRSPSTPTPPSPTRSCWSSSGSSATGVSASTARCSLRVAWRRARGSTLGDARLGSSAPNCPPRISRTTVPASAVQGRRRPGAGLFSRTRRGGRALQRRRPRRPGLQCRTRPDAGLFSAGDRPGPGSSAPGDRGGRGLQCRTGPRPGSSAAETAGGRTNQLWKCEVAPSGASLRTQRCPPRPQAAQLATESGARTAYRPRRSGCHVFRRRALERSEASALSICASAQH